MAKRKAAKARAKARKGKTRKSPAKRRASKTAGRKAAPRSKGKAKAKKVAKKPTPKAKAKAKPAAKKPAPKTAPKGHPAGTWSWVDLQTSDLAGAKRFYADLFGWSLDDQPMPAGQPGTYTTAAVKGGEVCGMNQFPPEFAGMPPHWNLYVSVDDVDATFAKALSHGAKPAMAPFDIPDVGRMAVFQDPAGASLSIWQRGSPHAGIEAKPGTLGTFCWGELLTTDITRATDFYTKVLPWSTKVGSFGDGAYVEFQAGKESVAGMMAITADMGPMPPNWSLYFSVADCEGAVKKAQTLGATLLMGPMDAEGVGRFAVLKDPQGATFNVIKFS